MRFPIGIALVASLIAAGCAHPRPAGQAVTSPAEQALLQRMTADPFIRVTRLDRDSHQRLLITTQQGDVAVKYIAVQPADGSDRLQCARLPDSPELIVADDGTVGTGPERRGIGVRH